MAKIWYQSWIFKNKNITSSSVDMLYSNAKVRICSFLSYAYYIDWFSIEAALRYCEHSWSFENNAAFSVFFCLATSLFMEVKILINFQSWHFIIPRTHIVLLYNTQNMDVSLINFSLSYRNPLERITKSYSSGFRILRNKNLFYKQSCHNIDALETTSHTYWIVAYRFLTVSNYNRKAISGSWNRNNCFSLCNPGEG